LLNFHVPLLADGGIRRVVNNHPEK
jgi:hypothetical protein